MLAYYGAQISPNQTETVEGYLICRNVPIARTGVQMYAARELGLEGDPERMISVDRRPEDVFEAAALASFEGKPVTDGHPPENVSPENFAAYARGHVQNIRRKGDVILADLYINDAVLADQVRRRAKREVSCGYLCTYVPDRDGYRQTHIRGNHVAVVSRGRAGREVAIKDAAQEAEKGRKYMSKFTEAILSAFGMAAKEASGQEELSALVATTATALDADPTAKAAEPTTPAKAQEAAQTQAQAQESAPAADTAPSSSLDAKLDRILEALTALKPAEQTKPETSPADSLEKLVEKLEGKTEEGEKAVTIPADEMADAACTSPGAKDAALAIVKAMRPVVASIQDKAVQAQVTDALLSAFRGPDVMGAIDAAAQSSARKAADAAGRNSYEQRCADSEAAYAARNPHKRTEKEV